METIIDKKKKYKVPPFADSFCGLCGKHVEITKKNTVKAIAIAYSSKEGYIELEYYCLKCGARTSLQYASDPEGTRAYLDKLDLYSK